jgi:hypothetical protein
MIAVILDSGRLERLYSGLSLGRALRPEAC